ncbi:MAG: tRNA (adenosine(37)-N6)-threonylcarbamoyltransferase complex dimerization subunit type 1 TsaB [Bacteroidales bacterium]|nr:tRNA (adenosine(37)-N6)-threonylcarbamoyltransferase complex dimerization subunit type 1 TsaB [Bacteroidales bacterium]
MIICLETATNLCSVALCNNAGVISLRESNDLKSHASMLTVFINEILNEAGIKARQLDAVAVSKGPGSYTGLRIGVSVAKGIAYAASIPLIGIDTMVSMFHGAGRKSSLYCPMLDARRMEVYYAVYNSKGETIRGISAKIITEDTFSDIPSSEEILIFGDGAAKCKGVIKRPNIKFDDSFRISASHMYIPAVQALKDRHFEDVAYFEPFYLKDFITSTPRKNVLGN